MSDTADWTIQQMVDFAAQRQAQDPRQEAAAASGTGNPAQPAQTPLQTPHEDAETERLRVKEAKLKSEYEAYLRSPAAQRDRELQATADAKKSWEAKRPEREAGEAMLRDVLGRFGVTYRPDPTIHDMPMHRDPATGQFVTPGSRR